MGGLLVAETIRGVSLAPMARDHAHAGGREVFSRTAGAGEGHEF